MPSYLREELLPVPNPFKRSHFERFFMSHIPNGWYMVLNRLPEGEFPGTSTPDSHPDTSMDISYELRLDLWEGDFPQKRPPLTAPVIVTDRGHFGNEARTLKRDALCRKLGGWIDVDPTTDAPAPDDIPWIMSRHLETPDLSLATMLRDEAKKRGCTWSQNSVPKRNISLNTNTTSPTLQRHRFPLRRILPFWSWRCGSTERS